MERSRQHPRSAGKSALWRSERMRDVSARKDLVRLEVSNRPGRYHVMRKGGNQTGYAGCAVNVGAALVTASPLVYALGAIRIHGVIAIHGHTAGRRVARRLRTSLPCRVQDQTGHDALQRRKDQQQSEQDERQFFRRMTHAQIVPRSLTISNRFLATAARYPQKPYGIYRVRCRHPPGRLRSAAPAIARSGPSPA